LNNQNKKVVSKKEVFSWLYDLLLLHLSRILTVCTNCSSSTIHEKTIEK
jgi:hypothetical protein